jgi:hypothetical protein
LCRWACPSCSSRRARNRYVITAAHCVAPDARTPHARAALQLKKKEKERKAAAGKPSATSAAAKAKSAADAAAFVCGVCRLSFPVNVKASPSRETHA